MRTIKAIDRLDAIQKWPKAKILRRIEGGLYEAFETKDEYNEYLLSIGKKVDKRWLKKRAARLGAQSNR